ncbi:tripartite tricarboxylate transporter TctB family protein [Bradyrhizobium sp. LHD-71]|uniref:tripartite tricarboxylate transporter TctB family protein n=1 Tax=Bradyrhizobium sp. LHD-71 TaxID=3072141 RepID=UPI00280D93BD|nr:tripartite tricarboxylate transporter TctB family protein [Bradyrhizobium sp. LHD-71]MDQ8728214.1 tripartite tricarboxylate transporter TctB family protein [Bradyrhizobium sp. LHD-71]
MTSKAPAAVDRQDVLAALLVGAVGLAGLWFGRGLAWGQASAMGPGYLPLGISWLLITIALLLGARAYLGPKRKLPAMNLRPLAVITAASLLFGFLLERLGLVCTTFVVAVLASFASADSSLRERLVLAATLSIASTVVFVFLLGQPIRLWWWLE